jgi:multisubunit Na+/H+ antiporter MnhC subunit
MFFSEVTDLHLFDTYFVLDSLQALLPVFLLVTFTVYVIKVFRDAFKQVLANWILVLTGLAVVITFAFFIKGLSGIFAGDFTSYPPLPRSGETQLSQATRDPAARFIITGLSVIQFAVLIILLYATYRSQKSRNTIKST